MLCRITQRNHSNFDARAEDSMYYSLSKNLPGNTAIQSWDLENIPTASEWKETRCLVLPRAVSACTAFCTPRTHRGKTMSVVFLWPRKVVQFCPSNEANFYFSSAKTLVIATQLLLLVTHQLLDAIVMSSSFCFGFHDGSTNSTASLDSTTSIQGTSVKTWR